MSARRRKDWPQLNFVVYHSAYRHSGGGNAASGWTEFEQTGRVSWVSDLADIPQKYGVTNVYGDVGQLFAQSAVAEPKLGAALMGILIKGLGADHVCWGTDAIWTGSPQWQIEALRRLEIPEDMQKKYGFAAAGRCDGTSKDRHFQRQQHAPLWSAEAHRPRRPVRQHEGGILEERRRAQQPALRLRPQAGGMVGLSTCRRRWRRLN